MRTIHLKLYEYHCFDTKSKDINTEDQFIQNVFNFVDVSEVTKHYQSSCLHNLTKHY